MSQHPFIPQKLSASGEPAGVYPWSCSKVVCVGRNYVEHAKELNNPVPSKPLLFIKPSSSLTACEGLIAIPAQHGACHHELELALLIGQTLTQASPDAVMQSVAGIGLALDLTLRDLQNELKKKGQPWEIAKAFDGACPVTGFIPVSELSKPLSEAWQFAMKKNGDYIQQGNSSDMIFPFATLLSEISHHFTLYPGDIVLTGTPEGVGALNADDKLDLYLEQKKLTAIQVSLKGM